MLLNTYTEADRLQELDSYQILYTPRERAFDELVKLSAELCNAPVAILSFFDQSRQWIKSAYGYIPSSPDRELSFGERVIVTNQPLVIAELQKDPDTRYHPWVIENPQLTACGIVPVQGNKGLPLGSLIVMTDVPTGLPQQTLEALEVVAHQITAQLELRKLRAQPVPAVTTDFHDHLGLDPLEQTIPDAAEAILRANRELYRRVVQLTQEGIVILDPSIRVSYVNTQMADLLGYSAKSLVGQSLANLTAPNRQLEVKQLVSCLMRNSKNQVDYWWQRQDGSELPSTVAFSPMFNPENQFAGALLMISTL